MIYQELFKVRSHCDSNGNGNYSFMKGLCVIKWDCSHCDRCNDNGNSNDIVVKWVVDYFYDGNGKNSAKYTHMQLFLLPLPLPSTSYEQISNEIVAAAVTV